METVHKSVMLEEAIEGLNLKKGDTVVDATLGGGGHSLKILEKIGETGVLIAIDRDNGALERFKDKIKKENLNIKKENLILVNDNFANIKNILIELGIDRVDAILADFGLSSDQLDDERRGFSFNSKTRLDMRMNPEQELSAFQVTNEYSEEGLYRIIKQYGEEKFAGSIVKKIIEKRKRGTIERADELTGLILEAVPKKFQYQKIHPATRTFQAIRMEVNRELESIEKFIREGIGWISPGGKMAVISFHSGEDRLVKNIFRDLAKDCECPPDFPVCRCSKQAEVKIITGKPILPQEKEVRENIRARSAKLRIVQKI
ncbi:MAG: 16S rRNA (cytosine(1402)-N(4))-methyltransferase RsmH [Candidatus Moraniibacteriota bacterium]